MLGVIYLILCVVLFYLYYNEKNKSVYWTKRGVKQVDYKPFVGILWDYIIRKDITLGHIIKDIYDQNSNELYVGCFNGNLVNLIIRDPKLIEHVLHTEHDVFNSRGGVINWEVDKLADNVLFMEGIRWKLTRQKLTPVFTSGKLRNMFKIMDNSGREFTEFIDIMYAGKNKHSLFNVITTFTASSDGAAVLGINANPGTDFNSPLHRMARESNTPTVAANIKFVFSFMFPKLFRLFKIKIFGDHEKFFVGLVKQILNIRKNEGTVRNDFIDNCIEIQKEKFLIDETTGYKMETTDELMAAQAFFFFIAGVDPTATTINFSLYELSKNPDILNELHKEIDEIFAENDNLTYSLVDSMNILEKIICESLRMYPPIGNIQRRCVRDHVFSDGLLIEKDVMVTIPILGIHRDEKYYPKPEVFDPERFSQEQIKKRPNYTFLPFGEGKRICIGMRFAKLQIKLGMIHLLRKFTVKPVGTPRQPTYLKSFFSLKCDDLNYTIVRRE